MTNIAAAPSLSGELLPAELMPTSAAEDAGPPRKKHVILFITNAKYADAVASSVRDLRNIGGYKDDVAIWMWTKPVAFDDKRAWTRTHRTPKCWMRPCWRWHDRNRN